MSAANPAPGAEDASADTEVLLELGDGGVARVVLNRPEKLNAITTDLARELRGALKRATAEADVVVISGAGGNFSAGGDFEHLQAIREDPDALRALFEEFAAACSLIAELPVPVIAAVEGVAMAGGFELMQASDVAVVAEGAKIADNHSNFAMIPGGGSTQRLPRLAGRQRSLGLILTGDRLSGREAVEWGLAYRCWPDAELDERVAELAAGLAAKDGTTLARIKRLVCEGLERPLAEGLRAELEAVLTHIGGEGGSERVGRFSAKRERKESG